MDALYLLLGVWNLAATYRSRAVYWTGRPRPIVPLTPGPAYTLHTPDGKAVPRAIGYNTSIHKPSKVGGVGSWSSVHKAHKWAFGRIRRNKKPDRISDWFRRYAKALSEPQYSSAFLKLWNLMEDLTFVDNGRAAPIVRRASSLWLDYNTQRQILNQLKSARHSHVHSEIRDEFDRIRLEQTKHYADVLLLFHLHKGAKYTDEELIAFLDAPLDREKLHRRLEILRDVNKFRRGK